MTAAAWRDIAGNGLWRHNPGLVQLLGLCPLLAVSNSVVNALGLGLATMAVLAGANLLVALWRQQLVAGIRLLVLVMLIAALTTCVELLMQTYTFKLYQNLGIFVPLIASNCVILDRAEHFARKYSPLAASFDGLMVGLGFMLLLLVLGAIREVLGTGVLLANLGQLLPFAADWQVQVFRTDTPFLLALLPPGALLALGLLIALKNVIDQRLAPAKPAAAVEPLVVGSKRVRVTGRVS